MANHLFRMMLRSSEPSTSGHQKKNRRRIHQPVHLSGSFCWGGTVTGETPGGYTSHTLDPPKIDECQQTNGTISKGNESSFQPLIFNDFLVDMLVFREGTPKKIQRIDKRQHEIQPHPTHPQQEKKDQERPGDTMPPSTGQVEHVTFLHKNL